MKRIMTLLLVFIMVLSLAACGEKEPEKTERPEKTKRPEATEKVTPEPEDTPEPESEGPEANFETPRWEAYVPEELAENEDDRYESSYSQKHVFFVMDGETELTKLTIEVRDQDYARSFRDDIISAKLSLEDYAAGDLDMVDLAGIQFYTYDQQLGSTFYRYFRGRDEGRKTTVSIEIKGDAEQACIGEFLDSLVLLTEDTGHTDEPYPWEGECYEPKTGSTQIGKFNFSATWLHADECFIPLDDWDSLIEYAGGYLYCLSHDDLMIYKMDGDALTLHEAVKLPNESRNMCSDKNGNVYISAYGNPIIIYNEGKRAMTVDYKEKTMMHPSGEWGLSYYLSIDDINKVTISEDGIATEEPFDMADSSGAYPVNMANRIFITEDRIFITGSSVSDNKIRLFEFDLDGNLLNTLDENGNGLGSITNVIKTANGVLAMDGNLRCLQIWNSSGEYLGSIKDELLFGTSYPWMSGLAVGSDGSIYASMGDERPDHSWDEVLMYRLETDF